MIRKVYEAPMAEVIAIDSEGIMLSMSVNTPDLMIDGNTSINTRDDQLTHGRRGTWGNLWADE